MATGTKQYFPVKTGFLRGSYLLLPAVTCAVSVHLHVVDHFLCNLPYERTTLRNIHSLDVRICERDFIPRHSLPLSFINWRRE